MDIPRPRRAALAAHVAGQQVMQAHAPMLEVSRASWSRTSGETVEVPMGSVASLLSAGRREQFLRWASRNGGLLLDRVGHGVVVWMRSVTGWQVVHMSGCAEHAEDLPVTDAQLDAVLMSFKRSTLDVDEPAGGPWRLVLVPLPEKAVAAVWMEREGDAGALVVEAGPAFSGLPAGALAPEAESLESLVDQLPGARTSAELAARAALRRRVERLSWRLKALSGGPFSRRGDGRSLSELLEDQRLTVSRRVPDGATLDWRVPEGLARPAVGPRFVRELLLELVENAGAAVTSGASRIRVRAGEMRFEHAQLWRETELLDGTWLWLEVADDGHGISDTQGDVFVAGVGADADGNRAGLGLTAVASALDHVGGAIRLRSAEGRGTVVQVALPIDRSTQPEGV